MNLSSFGIERAAFMAEYFERKPYLGRRAFDASNYGWQVIDNSLDRLDPASGTLKLLLAGRVDPARYTEEISDVGIKRRVIQKAKLYDLLDAGATMVLNRVELVSHEMESICSKVEQLTGAQTTGNAYCSIGSLAGTNPHWDTHDVFVVQLSGQKCWHVYSPTHPLPLINQTSKSCDLEVSRTPDISTTLFEGDVLYIPRGWWHSVKPAANSHTIHLTVAIHTPLVLDFFIWACANLLPNDQIFRRSLMSGVGHLSVVKEAVRTAMAVLNRESTFEAFCSRNDERQRMRTPFRLAELLTGLRPTLSSSSRARLNVRGAPHCRIPSTINGQSLSHISDSRRIVEFIMSEIEPTVQQMLLEFQDMSKEYLEEKLIEMARADILQLIEAGIVAE